MARRSPPSSPRLVLTCEHGGKRIPAAYAHLFRGAGEALASHRGWDPGALDAAKVLARRHRVPLHAVTWSRLLVESNRAPTNPRIWSAYTKGLPRAQRQEILERYWWPHRRDVEQAVRKAAAGGRLVLHVAVHSLTPVLDGEVRRADVAFLYDPARPSERTLCARWARSLEDLAPDLRVRMNYPYRGTADGLTTWLRQRLPPGRYAGVEVELNQALLAGAGRAAAVRALSDSLAGLLA